MPIKPPRLSPGDTLAIIAPASAPPDPAAIDKCVAAVRELGFKPRLGRNARKRWGYLAGTDAQRAEDLMRAFTDPKVRGIVCVRGGYGTSRLLQSLDYELIRKNAKVLAGYSDLTSLHCALLKQSGLVTFHGPMLNSEFIHPDLPGFTRNSFLETVCEPKAAGSIRAGYGGEVITLRSGRADGPMLGGNITLLCATLGTPFLPSFKGKVLFFEDLDEVPYRFDRMLTQLLNAGLLQQVKGIAIGINKNCADPKASSAKEYRQTLQEVFKERLLPLKVPVVMNLPFGHVKHNATLPIGLRATLDGDAGDLVIEEAAVQ